METYKVRIAFIDSSQIELDNVSNYRINTGTGMVEVVIDGYRQFFNINKVLYVGRVKDLDGITA